ncbi:MAG: hypothetical protein ABUL49_00755 [bacterium]
MVPHVDTEPPPPWAGTLDEFEDLVEALVVSRKAFLYAFFGWASMQAFVFTYFQKDLIGWVLGQIFCIVYVASLSIWAGRVYALAIGKNMAMASFLCGFGAILPFVVPFGFVAMQNDLIRRLAVYGLKAGKWKLDAHEVEAIKSGLDNFVIPDTDDHDLFSKSTKS